MTLELQVRSLTGQSSNGVPVISNAEYKGSIDFSDGEPAVVAGEITTNDQLSMAGIPGVAADSRLKSSRDRQQPHERRRRTAHRDHSARARQSATDHGRDLAEREVAVGSGSSVGSALESGSNAVCREPYFPSFAAKSTRPSTTSAESGSTFPMVRPLMKRVGVPRHIHRLAQGNGRIHMSLGRGSAGARCNVGAFHARAIGERRQLSHRRFRP